MKDYVDKDNLYCYEGTFVLKNRLNIKDSEELVLAEDEVTTVKIAELHNCNFDSKFDYMFFLWLHQFVFSDLYKWAGNLREVDISKENFKFAHYLYIENELKKIFRQLEDDTYLITYSNSFLAEKITFYMTELNVIHPFREGNGRIIREYFRILLEKLGYYIRFTTDNKDEYLKAMRESPYNATALKSFIRKNLRKIP